MFSEYLEDLYPEVALFPKDPFEKHRQRLLVETLGSKVLGVSCTSMFMTFTGKEVLYVTHRVIHCLLGLDRGELKDVWRTYLGKIFKN